MRRLKFWHQTSLFKLTIMPDSQAQNQESLCSVWLTNGLAFSQGLCWSHSIIVLNCCAEGQFSARSMGLWWLPKIFSTCWPWQQVGFCWHLSGFNLSSFRQSLLKCLATSRGRLIHSSPPQTGQRSNTRRDTQFTTGCQFRFLWRCALLFTGGLFSSPSTGRVHFPDFLTTIKSEPTMCIPTNLRFLAKRFTLLTSGANPFERFWCGCHLSHQRSWLLLHMQARWR